VCHAVDRGGKENVVGYSSRGAVILYAFILFLFPTKARQHIFSIQMRKPSLRTKTKNNKYLLFLLQFQTSLRNKLLCCHLIILLEGYFKCDSKLLLLAAHSDGPEVKSQKIPFHSVWFCYQEVFLTTVSLLDACFGG
jgi:hypothetical protein